MKIKDIFKILVPIALFILAQTLFYERRITAVETKVDMVIKFYIGGNK